ncbi:uncharacterized protein LOC125877383 [Solanum stenotomum]|uniref:uncharacterized protein LOC125877383 n=1 Tax=Solanum stenotomum TaxID=172797 RepID=UPI0020D1AA4D|nr:uncharacterized protein LOC125877383 [Solanum stenotomum]
MKYNFSSLISKVNSHADAMKMLEGKLSLLSAQLTSKTPIDYIERELDVVTRSGKVVIGDMMEDEDPQKHEESQGVEEQDLPILQSLTKEPHEEAEQQAQAPKVMHPLPKIPPPFPQSLLEMPGYAKFMKELVTKKKSLDYETIEVPHSCSAIMTNDSITKREDPGDFTIPCTIGMLQFAKALCDLGASINLMPYAIYKQLGLGEPKATTMRLFMADRSIKHPVGILYDILVKVDRFIFPTDFVILDCEIDAEIPIILGRPFLATRRALMDVESGKLKFRVNDDEVTFNIYRSMKQPSNIHVVSTEDVIDEAVASVSHLMRKNEPLESRKSPTKPSIEEPPNLELKALPSHLKYAFLGANNTLPVIIAANLLEKQVKLLIEVLRKHIKAIGWTIADIVGIPPGICTHKIRLDSEYMVEDSMEVFMDDFLVVGDTFEECLTHLGQVLQRCVEMNLVLNCEKCHFMVKEGIVLGHKVSQKGLEVDKAKIEVIEKLPSPISVKGVHNFLGHTGFYRRFIKDFSKIALPLCILLEKEVKFNFNDACVTAFQCLKEKLISTPIIISPNWSEYFELMCDASGMAPGGILVGHKVIIHTDHTAQYLMAKKDAKPRLIRCVLLLQEFDFKAGRRANVEHEVDIDDSFPDERVFAISLKHTPWYVDFANYTVCGLIPDELTFYQQKRFLFDAKKYFWDEPYLFRECADHVIRRCVPEEEAIEILHACHTSPVGGHHGGVRTAANVLQTDEVSMSSSTWELMDFLPVEVMIFRECILTFKQLEGERIHKSWARFNELINQCPNHDIPDIALLDCFYISLGPGNKRLVDQLIPGGITKHPYVIAAQLLNQMADTNQEVEKDFMLAALMT